MGRALEVVREPAQGEEEATSSLRLSVEIFDLTAFQLVIINSVLLFFIAEGGEAPCV